VHRCSRYLNNKIERDHRGIKRRYHSMRGFGALHSAARFCSAYDDVREYFRHQTWMGELVPLGIQREQFCARTTFCKTRIRPKCLSS
jgi:putative transposase